jgi:hypothetical protein
VGRGFESHLRLSMSQLALVDTLPEGTATIDAIPVQLSGNPWSTYNVTPSRSSAARVQVAVDAPGIFVSLGRGAVFELGSEDRDYSGFDANRRASRPLSRCRSRRLQGDRLVQRR